MQSMKLSDKTMRYNRLSLDKQANSAKSQMFRFVRELTMIYADDRDENQDEDSLTRRLNFHDMPVYKSFEFIDDTRESTGFAENDNSGFILNRKNENGVVRSQRESESLMGSNDLSHKAGYHKILAIESEGSKTRRKICVKKDAEDYNMPEMVAFFEDANYHLFKDMFMDSESVCQEKSMIEENELNRYDVSSIHDAESGDLAEETGGTMQRTDVTKELQLVAEDGNEKQNLTKNSLIEEGEDLEGEINDSLTGHPADLIKHDYKTKQHDSYKLMTKDGEDFGERDGVRDAQKICQNSDQTMEILSWLTIIRNPESNEAAWTSSLASSTTEAEKYKCSTGNAYEEKNLIYWNTESTFMQVTTEACGQDLETDNSGSGMSSARLERSIQSFNNRDYDGGFSSPEADDPPSGPISIRSSSSFSSSYSFAFPILASEWSGSPTKMENNADKEECPAAPIPKEKQLRKQSYWRLLICCKSIEEE